MYCKVGPDDLTLNQDIFGMPVGVIFLAVLLYIFFGFFWKGIE